MSGMKYHGFFRFGFCILSLVFVDVSIAFTQENSRNRGIDQDIAELFQGLIDADPQLRSDSLAPLFKDQLITHLQNPLTFENDLDSLGTVINIESSPDKRIKFYSWDERNEGTWWSIQCVAQFRTEQGDVVVQEVSTGEESRTGKYTDSGIDEIFEVKMDDTVYYVTFGSGSHGSGHLHKIVQVFSIQGNELVKCTSCFPSEGDLVIEYPRSQLANLTFDPLTNEISYNEFLLNEDIGFYEPTGRIVKLQLFK
jgi:hypothetical protein